jgi:hypothetical protein
MSKIAIRAAVGFRYGRLEHSLAGKPADDRIIINLSVWENPDSSPAFVYQQRAQQRVEATAGMGLEPLRRQASQTPIDNDAELLQ